MASRSVGKPIQLASPIEGAEDGDVRFQFNRNIISEMLHAERLQHTMVAVISVAGAFRKGKSFLLNFFLRFLRALSRGNTQDWIRSDENLSDGFHWRSGSQRDTTGILIWSEPFFIRKSNGDEVAVILMDTQGTFDHQSTQQDCTTIFAFSTLLSSVQIFNISRDIQETDLQYLRLFVEFAAMAKNSNEKVLQDLWFLVRDWQNPDEHEYGVIGGESYLRQVLVCDSGKPRENQELRRGIQRHFEKASCCLLPYPGKEVASATFQGEITRLDEEFLSELEQFIPSIAAPESISVKRVNGKELIGSELFSFLEVYFEAFCNGKLPTPRSIFTATVEMANISAASEAKQFFENSMQAFLIPEMCFDDEFLDIQGVVMEDALQKFNSMCMEPDSHEGQKARQKLQEELDDLRQRQRVHRELQSETITQDRKNQMLNDELRSLENQNNEGLAKMLQMESEFEERLQDIKRKSISKDEMERLLQEESTKQATARKELESRSQELCGRIDRLVNANESLRGELSEQERRSQQLLQTQVQQLRSENEEIRHQLAQSGRRSGSSCSVM